MSGEETQTPDSNQPIVITDAEANSYLKYYMHAFIPPGLSDPTIRITPERIFGSAEVDFDEFSKASSTSSDWGPKVLAAIFRGKQKVSAAGKLQTQNGHGTVKIETVVVGTTSIPDWLVEFVVENYLQPRYNFDLSKPFALPDHVSHIELGAGRAAFFRAPQSPH